MKTRSFALASSVLALLLLSSCATPGGDRPSGRVDALGEPGKTPVEPAARRAFAEAERLYEARKFDQAKPMYAQLRTRFPSGRAAMMSTYRLGSAAYYEGDYAAAAREYEQFLAKYPANDLSFDVTYNLAAAEYQQGRYDRALALLKSLRPESLAKQDPRRSDVITQLLAQSAAATGDHAGAAAAYLRQAQLAQPDEARRTTALENLRYHLGHVTDRAALDNLLAVAETPDTQGRVRERIIAMNAGEARVAVVESRSSASDRGSVGIILPLSGKQAATGKRALDGILLAVEQFGGGGQEVRVHVEDSQSNPAAAAQAVDRLANKGVMAIIGPISWREAIAVGDRAQRLGVPNLSLASRDGISERGAYLFQNALTPRIQLENLIEYCIRVRGMRRFAVVAPEDSFGKELTNLFWDLVERYGGTVQGYRTYPAESKDFQKPIRDLVLLGNVNEQRKLEVTRLAQWKTQQKQKTGKEPKAQLPPVVDFDAIFVPDQPKNVAQLAASLAYFDVQGVPLLGTTEWNSDQLYKRAGHLAEGALFPSSTASGGGRMRDFSRKFEDAFGGPPDLLASQAYEAMELLLVAARSGYGRSDIASKLASIRDFDSPLGTLSFDEQRVAKRKLPVLSLGSNGNVQVQQN